MSNLPALIRSSKPGSKYHITDDGHTTHCGRKISSYPETHALNINESERCPRCGDVVDFVKISVARSNEERAQNEEYERKQAEIKTTRSARNAARPALVEEIILNLAHITSDDIHVKTFPNMDEIKIPVLWKGEYFTVKIEVWNGEKE